MNKHIRYSDEVRKALLADKPVVALESTIIAHGMPYPQNIAMARQVEAIVRECGATPATIAVLNGEICVGCDDDTLEYLGKGGRDIPKAGKRDLPYLVFQRKDGATTVGATAWIAAKCGIPVFATGGIGGVHREAEKTFDISNDLEVLSECDVAVVSAGAKAILDLGRTLEYLETKGVEVIGYRTDHFPAFYTAKSPHRVNHRLDTPEEIARHLLVKSELGIKDGVLIANPIPAELEIKSEEIEGKITEALLAAKKENVTGKALTPYLLFKIKELTTGRSLDANIVLVYNNAYLAATIAVALKENQKRA
jgi:pseudouridine-5'-phosphate glycosidase